MQKLFMMALTRDRSDWFKSSIDITYSVLAFAILRQHLNDSNKYPLVYSRVGLLMCMRVSAVFRPIRFRFAMRIRIFVGAYNML